MITLHYHHNTTAYIRKNRINFAIYKTFSRNNVLSEGHTRKKGGRFRPAKSLAQVGRIILKYKPLPLYSFEERIGEKFIICLGIAHVCKHVCQRRLAILLYKGLHLRKRLLGGV